MSDENQVDSNNEAPAQSEREALKARADQMGIKYAGNIPTSKLKAKVNAAILGEPEEEEEVSVPKAKAKPKVETKGMMKARLRKEAQELVRVNVTCMNPAKREWEGEIFTASNSMVGTIKKYVPFNTEEGWHVPKIILNMIKDRKCQIFTTVRDSRGNTSRKGKQINEFAIEVLPNLTPDELKALARKQAMRNAHD